MGKLYDDVVVKLPVIIMYGDESEWDEEEKERVLGNDEAYGLEEEEEEEEGGGEVEGGGEEPEVQQDVKEQEVGDDEAEPEAGGDGDGENEDVEDNEGVIDVEEVADAGQQEEEAASQGQINLLTVHICQAGSSSDRDNIVQVGLVSDSESILHNDF